MIREAENFEFGALAAPFARAQAVAPPMAPVETALQAPVVNGETVEQEITRLTWSVLDGSASLTDRQRLAELVNSQHEKRRRV